MTSETEHSEQPIGLATRLLAVALDEGTSGVQRFFLEQSAGLSELEQHGMVVQFVEFLVPIPEARTSLNDRLGPAVQALGEAAQYELMVRGMAAAARIQIAEGEFVDADGVLKAMPQVAQLAELPYYTYLADVLKGEEALAQGEYSRASSVLEFTMVDIEEDELDPSDVRSLRVEILTNLIQLYGIQGDYGKLQERLEELDNVEGVEDTPVIALHRGLVAQSKGLLDEAAQYYQDVVHLSIGQTDLRWGLEALISLAGVEPEQATAHLAAASDLAQTIPDPMAETRVTAARTKADLDAGNFEEAREGADRLVDLDDPDITALRAEVYSITGPVEQARSLVKELLDSAEEAQLFNLLAHGHILASRVVQSADEKLNHAREAAGILEDLEDKTGLGIALSHLSEVELETGNNQQARVTIERLANITQEMNRPDLMALSELAQGLFAQEIGEGDAESHLHQALALATEHNLVDIAVRTLAALGENERAKALAREHGLTGEEA